MRVQEQNTEKCDNVHVFKVYNVSKESPNLLCHHYKSFQRKIYLKFRCDKVKVKINIIFSDCLNVNEKVKEN